MNDELLRLEGVASDSWYAHGANAASIRYGYEVFSRYIRKGRTLELGPAEGVMTELLVRKSEELTVVEGSSIFCEMLRSKFPGLKVICSLFETFRPDSPFDTIIMGHVLEHVEDPVDLLRRAKTWLRPGGRLIGAVPNARSLHREAAVIMGILPDVYALSEADKHHGHRRVFDSDAFRRVFDEAGFCIEVAGGYWLKPLTCRQIDESWTPDMIEAFMKLGERYSDIAGEIYIVACTGVEQSESKRARRGTLDESK